MSLTSSTRSPMFKPDISNPQLLSRFLLTRVVCVVHQVLPTTTGRTQLFSVSGLLPGFCRESFPRAVKLEQNCFQLCGHHRLSTSIYGEIVSEDSNSELAATLSARTGRFAGYGRENKDSRGAATSPGRLLKMESTTPPQQGRGHYVAVDNNQKNYFV